MIYVKINNVEYPATVYGVEKDGSWNDRETKTIVTDVLTLEQAKNLFIEGCSWSIIAETERYDENEGHSYTTRDEFDNSDFNIPGPLTDLRDGRISIKMGKKTNLEYAYELLYGGV